MDIQSEINKLQAQIDILRNKQEEQMFNDDSRFTMGHIWVDKHYPQFIVKTLYIETSHHEDAKYGYVYLDGSVQMFDTKVEMCRNLLYRYNYIGEDKNRKTYNEKQ